MSSSGLELRRGYKLIPLLNSDDSDLSDEELRCLNRDGFQVITNKLSTPSVAFRRSGNNQKFSPKKKMNVENNLSNIFISSRKKNRMPCEFDRMSKERKISFGLSIILCFFVVALFLIIPCNWSNCSRKAIRTTFSEIWKKTLPNLELVGPITPVYSVDKNNFNFVFMARGCIFADTPVIRTNFTSSFGGDALCLKGVNGEQIWRKHFNKMPNDLDCSILSTEDEAQKDCIIISYSNFLTVLSSEKGHALWMTPITPGNNKTKQSFPILLPHSNSDTSMDLLITRDASSFMIISGRNGSIDTRPTNCFEIKNLRLSHQYDLLLECLMINYTIFNMTIPLYEKPIVNSSYRILQHEPIEKSNRSFVHNLTIFVTNEGTVCPRTCESAVQISSFQKKIVWSRKFHFAYVMAPQSFDLTTTFGVYGFVFKIWEHQHDDKELKRPKMLHNSKKLMANLIYERTVMVLFNGSHHESAQTANVSCYAIRQLYDTQNSVQPDPVSHKHSQTCYHLGVRSQMSTLVDCYNWPCAMDDITIHASGDINGPVDARIYDRHSMFISDVWKNGSYHLVSYYSTFEEERKNNYSFPDYMLKSYVRMYDLEKEVFRSLNFSVDEF